MSTTFAVDDGSVAQAESQGGEDASILYSRNASLISGRSRQKSPRRHLENPNTPTAARRRNRSTVPVDDVQTATRCREALRWITTLPEGAVRVTVHTGRVRLEGKVQRRNEREIAEETIRQLDGVSEVENLIDIN